MRNNYYKLISSIVIISILNTNYALADLVADPVVEPSIMTNPIVIGSVSVIVLVIAGFFGLKFLKNKKNKTGNSDNNES